MYSLHLEIEIIVIPYDCQFTGRGPGLTSPTDTRSDTPTPTLNNSQRRTLSNSSRVSALQMDPNTLLGGEKDVTFLAKDIPFGGFLLFLCKAGFSLPRSILLNAVFSNDTAFVLFIPSLIFCSLCFQYFGWSFHLLFPWLD